MKREIKFRGKRIDTGEWIFGSLHIPNKLLRGVYICPDTTFGDLVPGFKDGDDFEEMAKLGCAIGRYHRVDIESVGQYTGLKDKNGQEIYEGDIVKIDEGDPVAVSYENIYASFGIYRKGWAFLHYFHEAVEPEDCEVIGNVHDNPELLKQEAEQ